MVFGATVSVFRQKLLRAAQLHRNLNLWEGFMPTTVAVRDEQMLIGGEWGGALDKRTYEKKNPFTGAVVSKVPAGKRG
jgi:hypothetical protein